MSVIDDIKSRLDIVEVVAGYTNLKRSGRNYKALCPFHTEKTPSFVVFPETQHWHCFGACGEGGDVFTFVMKHEGWDFRTALHELAAKAGIELQPRTPAQMQAEQLRDRLTALLSSATDYYHHLLLTSPEGKPARAYISERGLGESIADQFQLGYSLPRWDSARTHLLNEGYSSHEIETAGLTVPRRDGSGAYDRFRDRLMIPIKDSSGAVVGFGARTLDPGGTPKYLNSPQTELFDKSALLFGLDAARRHIRRENQAVIVEGYMDVMQAHQAGFQNVVAQMGTALTEQQLKQLQRHTDRFVLALDPDSAGVQATLRGVEVARDALEREWEPVFDPRGLVGREARLGAEIRILELPQGMDPDDLLRESPEAWTVRVDNALPVVDFFLQMLTSEVDTDDSKIKAQIVDRLVPVLRAVANPVEREAYIQKIGRVLQIDHRAVATQVKSKRGTRREAALGSHQDGRGAHIGEDPRIILERHVLAMLAHQPGLMRRVDDALAEAELEPVSAADFDCPGLRAIYVELSESTSESGRFLSVRELRARLPEEILDNTQGVFEAYGQVGPDDLLARDAIRTILRMREDSLRRQGQELNSLAASAQQDGDLKGATYASAQRSKDQRLSRIVQVLYGGSG
jgi:DNA primase